MISPPARSAGRLDGVPPSTSVDDSPDSGGAAIRTADLDYRLPSDRIAQHPCEPRDAARLMVLDRGTQSISHRVFRDLPEFLRAGDCLVVNTTKVLPARFELRRATGGRLEALFLREEATGLWSVMLTGAGKLREGEQLEVWHRLIARAPGARGKRGLAPRQTRLSRSKTGASAVPDPFCHSLLESAPWRFTFVRHLERGRCELRVDPPDDPQIILERIGETPLPPYIRREQAAAPVEGGSAGASPSRERASVPQAQGRSLPEADERDRTDYQTVYARQAGAVAAPTAGLHFTQPLLDRIRARGVEIAEVVLHVGLGTFQPVEAEDLADHPMHSEWYAIDLAAAEAINRSRRGGGRIVPVGTTSVRVLETVARADGRCRKGGAVLHAASGWTNLLIQPPYHFRCADALITNFHLPRSTLLALVFAFAGRDFILDAYRTAIDSGYRFYSFGDAMFIS